MKRRDAVERRMVAAMVDGDQHVVELFEQIVDARAQREMAMTAAIDHQSYRNVTRR